MVGSRIFQLVNATSFCKLIFWIGIKWELFSKKEEKRKE
jgi:hypothetical protein